MKKIDLKNRYSEERKDYKRCYYNYFEPATSYSTNSEVSASDSDILVDSEGNM